jgi:Ca2+-binding RTX toxin-like protein
LKQRVRRVLLLSLIVAAVPAGSASAATVALDGATLRFAAQEGDANHPTFHHRAEDELVVYDPSSNPLIGGPGCTQDGPNTVICPRAGVTGADFYLGDRGPRSFTPDMLTLTAEVPIPVGVRADTGSGAGVSYIDLRPIQASLDGAANDGPAMRGDNLGAGVDRVFGGDGADVLRGNDRANALAGDQGADDIAGGAGDDGITLASFNDVGADAVGLESRGADTADCGPGRDTVYYDRSDTISGCELRVLVDDTGFHYRGTSGADRIIVDRGPADVRGGSGNDRLGAQSFAGGVVFSGGVGNDRIAGNRGDDRITGDSGRDTIFGAEGRDRINARDGSTDTIACGPGRDTVTADRRDRVRRDCERVSRR